MKMLDKYILKQVIEMFIMGVLVFTSIIFASDTFITLIKQISMYGIPFKIAFLILYLWNGFYAVALIMKQPLL